MRVWLLLGTAVAIATVSEVAQPSIANAASVDARRFEVAGVKLEMTVDEAQAALKAYDPALQIEMRKQTGADGTTDLYLDAVKPDTAFARHYSEEVAIAFTRSAPQRAFAVIHDLALSPGHERVFPDVEKQIIETHGATAKTVGGFNDWVFDATGAPFDGAINPATNETSEKFMACWHDLFERTVSIFHVNFGITAPNALPTFFHPGCGVSVRVIVQTFDPKHPEAVQQIFERLMSDALAVADGRPTQSPTPSPEQVLRRLNPHGPGVPDGDDQGTDGKGQL